MIAPTEQDNPAFLLLANKLLASEAVTSSPQEIYIIKIRGWFDAKWCRFSGKVLDALGVWDSPPTIPPFNPNRVLQEEHFLFSENDSTYERETASPIHISQPSSSNLHRAVSRFSDSAVFLWYSSETANLDRGSVMIYSISDGLVSSWYASFHQPSEWTLDRHRGISPLEIERLLSSSASLDTLFQAKG